MGKGMMEGSWVWNKLSEDEGVFVGGDDQRDYEGVEMTCVNLKHLGFTRHSDEWWWIMERKYVDRNGMDMVMRVVFKGGGGEGMIVIENPHTGHGMNFGFIRYIHNLQMFYLAVSGQELRYVA